eukprot:816100-Prorocentrum_minimum.AAC.4
MPVGAYRVPADPLRTPYGPPTDPLRCAECIGTSLVCNSVRCPIEEQCNVSVYLDMEAKCMMGE